MPFCSKSLTRSLTDAKSLNNVCHRVLYMHGHKDFSGTQTLFPIFLNIYNIQWRTKLSSRFQEFICIISRLLWLSLRRLWGAANKYRPGFTSKHEHNWVFPALGWRLAGFWLVSHLFSVYTEGASFFRELQSINLSNYVGNMLHWFEHQLLSSRTLWLMLPPISCNILIFKPLAKNILGPNYWVTYSAL